MANHDLAPGALQKPERRAAVKKKEKRQRFLDRRRCREAVYRREQMKCQRCGKVTKHPRECYPTDPDMAHVHEPEGRRYVDYTNPDNCELLCAACHMPNGQHAPTAQRVKLTRRV